MKNAHLTHLVEQAILSRMQVKASFTALDISNRLKADRYPVRHRAIAEVVREVYNSGAMAHYDYERQTIPVVTEGGTKRTQAFLYHFQEVRPRAYVARDQDALPPIPPGQARDLHDFATAAPLSIRPRLARIGSQPRRRRVRRDGALSIPRCLLAHLNWTDGLTLRMTQEAGQFVIEPAAAVPAAGTKLHIWSGQRLRVCRTKLLAESLSAENVTVTAKNGQMRIVQLTAR